MGFTVSTTVAASFHPGAAFNATALRRGPIPRTSFSRPPVTARAQLLARADSQRATWLRCLDPPPHLDGTRLRFDPLGLGEDPESLKWYVQAELVHCRFSMAGIAGILFTDLLRVTGVSNHPVWYEAGATEFNFASTRALFVVQLLLMGFAETKRYTDFKNPGSQAKEGTFLGLEAALEGLKPGYPGAPLFNPLGLAKDIENAGELKLKEIKNGRLAMVAMLGFFVQASNTHAGPIDNLIAHPFSNNIIQTLFPSVVGYIQPGQRLAQSSRLAQPSESRPNMAQAQHIQQLGPTSAHTSCGSGRVQSRGQAPKGNGAAYDHSGGGGAGADGARLPPNNKKKGGEGRCL